jgi:tRNA threonylcarbamoyl adenosine modification protein YeaZ
MDNKRVILSVDTSTPVVSLALSVTGGQSINTVITTKKWRVESSVAEELLLNLDLFLDRSNLLANEITGLVVVAGPGRYAALRVGIATVQGIGLGLDIPIAPISRLLADSWDVLERKRLTDAVTVIHDAGSTGVVWQKFQRNEDGSISNLNSPQLNAHSAISQIIPQQALLTGDMTDLIRQSFAVERLSNDRFFLEDEETVRALSALKCADSDPSVYLAAGLIDAIYVRPPHITKSTGT